jgi:hypothetical protein
MVFDNFDFYYNGILLFIGFYLIFIPVNENMKTFKMFAIFFITFFMSFFLGIGQGTKNVFIDEICSLGEIEKMETHRNVSCEGKNYSLISTDGGYEIIKNKKKE